MVLINLRSIVFVGNTLYSGSLLMVDSLSRIAIVGDWFKWSNVR
jgi:hypothetical protein